MKSRPITLVELPEFQKHAEDLLGEEELSALKDYLAYHPDAGDLMPGTGGVRKLRWKASGRGKRGGSRVIYYFQDMRFPILLLTIFAKNVKTDLTKAQQNELRGLVELINKSRRR